MNKILFSILLLFPLLASAQTDLSLEFQAYPTGLIPGLRVEYNFAERHAMHLRFGYQLINHRDLGPHDSETGNGYGLSLGYKRYFKEGHEGLFLGARSDVWLNNIDWTDNIGATNQRSGTTMITVVQPTLEGGYAFIFGDNWLFAPSLGFGFEVNVRTVGEPTGEGPILLLGFLFGKRF